MKKIFAYIHYFFYLGWNWNFRLATVILLHEIRGEKKYGIHSTGMDDLTQSISEDELEHASIYQPVNYLVAEWLFDHLDKNEIKKNSFLDVGCGRGRVMAMAAWYGFKKIYGFDISPALCHDAIRNLEDVQLRYPEASFDITCADARYYEISPDISIIFLFNPFNAVIMQAFLDNLMTGLEKHPRKITVLYANPECGDLLKEKGFVATASMRRLTWLQGTIFEYDPENT